MHWNYVDKYRKRRIENFDFHKSSTMSTKRIKTLKEWENARKRFACTPF